MFLLRVVVHAQNRLCLRQTLRSGASLFNREIGVNYFVFVDLLLRDAVESTSTCAVVGDEKDEDMSIHQLLLSI